MVDHITRKKRKAFYEDKHTIRDGRVLLFRRKGNTRKIWQCRVKLMGLKGYVTKSTGTHIYEEAVEFSGDLFDDLRQKVKDRRPLKKHLFIGAAQRAERGFTKVWDERKGEYVDHGLRDNISSLD